MAQTILELQNIKKSYGGVHALRGVSFDLRAGEVHSLIGENGAGKSTLIKIISGAISDYEGKIILRGEEARFKNPLEANQAGIATIYQERSLIPYLNGAENIMLGKEPEKKLSFVDRKELNKRARKYIDMVAPGLPLNVEVRRMSAAQQQLIEIAKALSREPEVIIMDEPTSSLTDNETSMLIKVVKDLSARGISIIFISHKLPDIFAISQRITVLRDGSVIETRGAEGVTEQELVRMMVGREIKDLFPKENITVGEEVLRVENLSRRGKFKNVSFSVHAGEILGVSGLVGAGRSEMAMCVFGGDRADSGKIYLYGREVKIDSTQQAIKLGIGMVPEDRKLQGLVQIMSIRNNIILPILDRTCKLGFNETKKQDEVVGQYVDELEVKTESIGNPVNSLSGGNQQKVVISKWLASEPKVLIVDEPTRGIDVGTKAEIYRLIGRLAQRGIAILLISSEMPEILGLSDRIMVMREGEVVDILERADATEEKILKMYLGGNGNE